MSQRERCPIPAGWIVNAYPAHEERGIRMRAIHESGHEIEVGVFSDEGERPIDGAIIAPLWDYLVNKMNMLSDCGLGLGT